MYFSSVGLRELKNQHYRQQQYTHVGFYGLRGLSIGVMVFILYKLYVLLPYTYPTPKLSPHRRRCISTFPPKNSLCMIYKRFKLWGHWKCPHKSPSPCNTCHTHVIIQICVLINHINMPILVCMVHCGNVLSMIILWSLSSALTSEGADWDILILTDSRVNIFMHKSWFINNSLTLTTNSKSMEKYSMFEQIVINIYMKFLKWH